MLGSSPVRGLVVEAGQHGLLFGPGEWSAAVGDTAEENVANAMAAVRAYIGDPVLPDGCEFPGLTAKQAALAVVAGARAVAARIESIEKAAARIAREEHGVTVRELAGAAGITERAAASRYRRTPLLPPVDPAAGTENYYLSDDDVSRLPPAARSTFRE